MTRRFDAIIIGAGQAGPPLAGRLTAAGQTVALIERKLVGGTCVNVGCTPTKALVASAHVAHAARRAAEYGVTLPGPVGIDFGAIMARKDAIAGASRQSVEDWLAGMEGLTLIRGHARFIGPETVEVDGEALAADRVFINVGARAAIPDFPGIEKVDYLTSSSILALKTLPEHLVVIGGSYIGLEFAQIFMRFGARVSIVEKGPKLIGREDPEISDAVQEILESEGIGVRTGAECIGFSPHEEGISVSLDCTAGDPEIIGSHLLLAVGRTPNTGDLGLEAAGIATDPRGYISVDERLTTSNSKVFALGDCNGRGAFTHTSYNDFEIVAANLLDGADRKLSDRHPSYALYIDPPLGRVGLTANQARRQGHAIRIGSRPMSRVGRAKEKGETAGLMEIVVDAETDKILGAAILGVGGDEAIHSVISAIYGGAQRETLARAVPVHPTVAELIPTLLAELGPVLPPL